jgi:hypothetical protein
MRLRERRSSHDELAQHDNSAKSPYGNKVAMWGCVYRTICEDQYRRAKTTLRLIAVAAYEYGSITP